MTHYKRKDILVNYFLLAFQSDLTDVKKQSLQARANILWSNSAILFSLIENLEIIRYNIRGGDGTSKQAYTRLVLQGNFDKDLFSCSQNLGEFEAFLVLVQDSGNELFLRSTYFEDFSHLSGIEADEVREVRLDFIENGRLEQVELKDKSSISNLLTDLSAVKLVAAPKQKKPVPPTNGVYIFISTGNKEAFYYFDYTTGGIAKYLPTMSSYPNFTYRFVDVKRVQEIIGQYTGTGSHTLEEAVS